MEADWEIEIGPGAPVIDGAWQGYIDLRSTPHRVAEIVETSELPALATALSRINFLASPVWTAKCDVWPVNALDPEAFDPSELDADPQDARSALACYIDLIPAAAHLTLDAIVDWCRRLCLEVRSRPLPQCRLDLVVRRALPTARTEGLAVTVYITACGPSPEQASAVLSRALAFLADSLVTSEAPGQQPSKYNQDMGE